MSVVDDKSLYPLSWSEVKTAAAISFDELGEGTSWQGQLLTSSRISQGTDRSLSIGETNVSSLLV